MPASFVIQHILFAHFIQCRGVTTAAAHFNAKKGHEVMREKAYFERIFVGVLFLLPVLAAGLTYSSAAYSSAGLDFFRVVEDKKMHDMQPQNFEPLVLTDKAGSYETYVERTPSFSINGTEIKSVTIEKAKVYQKDEKYGFREKHHATKDFRSAVPYEATFSLSEKAGKRFAEFAEKHAKELVDARLGKHRLATAQFIGPFKSYQFTVLLEETSQDRLREIFSLLKNKIVWK
jgi:hypothetical protein